MKRLKIRNLGPLSEVDLDFGKVKVIIGLQSSGKSCVLKTACCCSWIEKRIHLVQSSDEFSCIVWWGEKCRACGGNTLGGRVSGRPWRGAVGPAVSRGRTSGPQSRGAL